MAFILEFGNENRTRVLGTFDTEKDARAAMVKDLSDEGIKPYYYRSWKKNDTTECIDYGSYTTFYYIRKEE